MHVLKFGDRIAKQRLHDVSSFRKVIFLKIFGIRKLKHRKIEENELAREETHSTSPPSGNLNDDLAVVCRSTGAVGEDIKMVPAKDGTTLLETCRVHKVLLDEFE